MSTILDKIVASKRREIDEQQQATPMSVLERRLAEAPPVRSFRAVLDMPGEVAIIAEVKKASPSAGVLRADFDPVHIARIYAEHGAAAISVLTDEPFFQGQLAYLTAVRHAVSPPVLRKDFILERYQLVQARAAGADAVLLIAEILDEQALPRLLKQTHDLGMQALVELYDTENVQRVVDSGAEIIGVNNRDLRSFVTRLEHTLELAERIPKDRILVSESGIRGSAEIQRLRSAGVKAALIGETFMRAPDIGAKLDELRS